jgi:hypothetical protein
MPARQKSKAYATGIAAGAEDVKYQAKYKELKRKVKEIETVRIHVELYNSIVHRSFAISRIMTSSTSKSCRLRGASRE